MNTINEVNDLFEQMDQEFNHQDFYGLQYIIDDLIHDSITQPEEKTTTDWYGLDDLSIE